MSVWFFLLFAILIFAPKGASQKSDRFDFRAVALLLCVIAMLAQM